MTTKISRIQWKNYGEFSVHYTKNTVHVKPHYKKVWVEQTYSKDYFNPYQYFLYRRCHVGLKVYSPDEIQYLSRVKRKRIESVHTHSLEVINLFKQKAMNVIIRKFFDAFSQTRGDNYKREGTLEQVLRHVFCNDETDPEYICTLTLQELGITPKMMALELVEKRCLPHNFFELTIKDDPRLIRLKKPEGRLDEL